MLDISTELKLAYINGGVEKTLIIEFPELNITVDEEAIYFESMSLSEVIMSSENTEFVGCNASKFEVKLQDFGVDINKKVIKASIVLDGFENEPIPLFEGVVDEVTMESNKRTKSVVAYDYLYSYSSKDVTDWYNSLSNNITIGEIRNSLFEYIGWEQEDTVLPNDDVVINKEGSKVSGLNALTLMKSICQINGVYGIQNRSGIFEYRDLATSVSETIEYYKNLEYQEFTVDPVDLVTVRKNTDNDTGSSYGTGTNNYIVQGNMFSFNQNRAVCKTLAKNIYLHIKDITYIPVKIEQEGYPWIECGDKLSYEVYDFEASEQAGEDVYKAMSFHVFSRTLSGIQSLSDTFESDGDKTQREFVTSIDTNIELLKNELEETNDKINNERVVRYYNYILDNDMTVNTDYSRLVRLTYSCEREYQVNFHGEIKITATEDCYLYIQYHIIDFVSGDITQNYVPIHYLKAGENTLNQLYFWITQSEYDMIEGKFDIYLKVSSGSATILTNEARGYLEIQGEIPEKELEEIVVTHMPNKTAFYVNTNLDLTGTVITAKYNNGETKVVTNDCTFDPDNGSLLEYTGYQDIYVEYQEAGGTYSTDFEVEVVPAIDHIEITNPPDKVEYEVGEEMHLQGIYVTGYDTDGNEYDITNVCEYEPAEEDVLDTPGEIPLVATYTDDVSGDEYTDSMNITVIGSSTGTYIVDGSEFNYRIRNLLQ